MKPILVLGGNEYKMLSVIRSLGKKGLVVHVGDSNKNALGFHSKYCHKKIIFSKNENFLNNLKKILKKEDYMLVILSSEGDSLEIAKNKKEFPDLFVLPNYKQLLIASNKEDTMKLAKNLNIPIPKTFKISEDSQIKKRSEKLKYPLIIKPGKYGVGSKTRPSYAFHPKEFVDKYREYHKETPNPIIQEVIIGRGYGVFLLCKKGKVLQYFVHERLIEQDPKGSGSARCKSFPLTKELKEYSDKIVKHLNWEGVIMLEFKRDGEKGEFKLIEINPRFWGSLPLAMHSGINFPYGLYCLKTNKKIEQIKKWKITESRYILGELIYLARVFKGSPKGWRLYFPSKIEAINNVLFKGKLKNFFVFDIKDIKPFFLDILRVIKQFKKLK